MYTFQNPKSANSGLSESGKLVLVGFLSALLGILVTVLAVWLWNKHKASRNNYEVLEGGSH